MRCTHTYTHTDKQLSRARLSAVIVFPATRQASCWAADDTCGAVYSQVRPFPFTAVSPAHRTPLASGCSLLLSCFLMAPPPIFLLITIINSLILIPFQGGGAHFFISQARSRSRLFTPKPPIATNNLEYKYALRPQEEVEQRVMLSYELSA